MKKIFLSLMMFLLGVQLFAQNYIAVQSGDQVSLFTHLEDAIAAANAGDDIYLPGGIVQVHNGSNVVVGKRLNLYGVGYNALTTLSTGRALINAYITFNENSNGSLITGVHVSNINASNANNLTIKRCKIEGTIDLQGINSNIFIAECFMAALHSNDFDDLNIVVDKCVIGNVGSYYRIIRFNGLVCKNSIVVASHANLYAVNNSVFDNCVVMNQNLGWGFFDSSAGNVFSNCIFTESAGASFSGQIISNAIYDQSFETTFVNYNGGSFDPSFDYHLKPGSPGISAGTDGTDIGLYGSSQPFKDGGLPDIPHIVYKSISGSTDQNGKLQINIQVEAQDY